MTLEALALWDSSDNEVKDSPKEYRSRSPILEALESRQLLGSNLVVSQLTLTPPASQPLGVGQAASYEVEICNLGDTAAQPISGELDLTRHRSSRPTHAVGIRTSVLAPDQCQVLVIDVPPINKSGLYIAQATLEPEGPQGDPRNDDNSKGISVQVGTPDFEIVADPRIMLKTPPLRGRGRNDLTLLGIETPIEVRVRNNGPAGPMQSYVEVTASRFGFDQPEWVGVVEFDLRRGQTLRAIAENNRPDDGFARFWTPQHAGVYILSAVVDPPLAGQPRGAVLETIDTNGNSPDPDEYFANNAKFAAVHVHVQVPPKRGEPIDWLRSMLTPDQAGGPGSLIRSYLIAEHPKRPLLNEAGDKPLAELATLEWVSSSYDNALTVTALVSMSDFANAKLILSELQHLQSEDGGFPFAWHAPLPSRFVEDARRTVGNNAWTILAVDWYTLRSGDRSFLDMAQKTAEWILNFKDQMTLTGCVRGGDNGSGTPLTFISTEHQLDSIAALDSLAALVDSPADAERYREASATIRRCVQERMWIESEGRFRRGLNDDLTASDVQTWGVLVLGPTGPNGEDYTRALSWTRQHCTFIDRLFKPPVTGIDFNCRGSMGQGPDTNSSEQTEGLALALRHAGDLDGYRFIHGQVGRLRNTDGGVRYTSRSSDVADDELGRAVTLESVAGTAWWLFAERALNPFLPLGPSLEK